MWRRRPLPRKRRVLGTPTDSSWPNVTDLDDWNVGFPQWPRIGLAREYKDLGEIGINMLEVRKYSIFSLLNFFPWLVSGQKYKERVYINMNTDRPLYICPEWYNISRYSPLREPIDIIVRSGLEVLYILMFLVRVGTGPLL